MERLTQKGHNYCYGCGRSYACEHDKDSNFPKCGDAATYDRLKYYEDLEEQGRLVVLPAKVGDTVYFRTYAKNATVDLGIQPHEVIATTAYVVTKGEFTNVGHPLWNFGKTVFLTREAAEAALHDKNVGDMGGKEDA